MQAVVEALLCRAFFFVCTEGSYDGEEEGQGEFDSFVEPAGLILSSFIEKNLMGHGGKTWLRALQPQGTAHLDGAVLQMHLPAFHHRMPCTVGMPLSYSAAST